MTYLSWHFHLNLCKLSKQSTCYHQIILKPFWWKPFWMDKKVTWNTSRIGSKKTLFQSLGMKPEWRWAQGWMINVGMETERGDVEVFLILGTARSIILTGGSEPSGCSGSVWPVQICHHENHVPSWLSHVTNRSCAWCGFINRLYWGKFQATSQLEEKVTWFSHCALGRPMGALCPPSGSSWERSSQGRHPLAGTCQVRWVLVLTAETWGHWRGGRPTDPTAPRAESPQLAGMAHGCRTVLAQRCPLTQPALRLWGSGSGHHYIQPPAQCLPHLLSNEVVFLKKYFMVLPHHS